eukprot:Clim_evm75s218 gene=Clim_evmTU75s218
MITSTTSAKLVDLYRQKETEALNCLLRPCDPHFAGAPFLWLQGPDSSLRFETLNRVVKGPDNELQNTVITLDCLDFSLVSRTSYAWGSMARQLGALLKENIREHCPRANHHRDIFSNSCQNGQQKFKILEILSTCGCCLPTPRVFIVLRSAEQCAQHNSSAQQALTYLSRLSEMVGTYYADRLVCVSEVTASQSTIEHDLQGVPVKVSVVAISSWAWDLVRGIHLSGRRNTFVEPYIFFFRGLAHSTKAEILVSECPDAEYQLPWRIFVNILRNSLHIFCGDLREWRHAARQLWPVFIGPVRRGEVDQSDASKLYQYISPFIREVLHRLHLRELSTVEWNALYGQYQRTMSSINRRIRQEEERLTELEKRMETEDIDAEENLAHFGDTLGQLDEQKSQALRSLMTNSGKQAMTTRGSSREMARELELPLMAKYLLLASFICSFNPAKMDRRFFVARSNPAERKKRQTKATMKAKERTRQTLLGPKMFPANRLMAIFHSLAPQDQTTNPSDVLIQVQTLISLRFLAKVGRFDDIDNPKFKCLASLDLVKAIGCELRVDVTQYLADYYTE